MTDLVKQLEDKKKGCNVYISEVDNWCGYFNGNVTEDTKDYCPKCREIIAILEQAIAEIKKQRQEEIEFLTALRFDATMLLELNNLKDLKSKDIRNYRNRIKERLEQLNQPKTKQDEK